ncbi:MAG: 4Fe-4S dicluster domain-containing protein [Anaerolineales bacterium]
MNLKRRFKRESAHRQAFVEGQVVPDSTRCVQCGICSFNCPIEIDVRRHAWQGKPVKNSRCLTCGQCVALCPRGVLAFERTNIFGTEKREIIPPRSSY